MHLNKNSSNFYVSWCSASELLCAIKGKPSESPHVTQHCQMPWSRWSSYSVHMCCKGSKLSEATAYFLCVTKRSVGPVLRDSCPYSFSLHRPNRTFPGEPGAAVRGWLSQPSFSALHMERQHTENCNKLQPQPSLCSKFCCFQAVLKNMAGTGEGRDCIFSPSFLKAHIRWGNRWGCENAVYLVGSLVLTSNNCLGIDFLLHFVPCPPSLSCIAD